MDLSKEEIYYPFTYIAAVPDFLERNGRIVTSSLAGAIEGVHRFKTDKPFAKKVMAKYLSVQDESVLEEAHGSLQPAL